MSALRRMRKLWIPWVTTIVLACFSDAVARAGYRVTDLGDTLVADWLADLSGDHGLRVGLEVYPTRYSPAPALGSLPRLMRTVLTSPGQAAWQLKSYRSPRDERVCAF